MIAIGMAPFPALGPLKLAVKMVPSSHPGCVNVITADDGTVLSIQPDGSIDTRPPGTDGAYEQGAVNGNFVLYCPDGISVYAFPLFLQVP